jgi:hypothetical protein
MLNYIYGMTKQISYTDKNLNKQICKFILVYLF